MTLARYKEHQNVFFQYEYTTPIFIFLFIWKIQVENKLLLISACFKQG